MPTRVTVSAILSASIISLLACATAASVGQAGRSKNEVQATQADSKGPEGKKVVRDRGAKNDAVDEKAIGALIAQLGDESFDKREAAQKRLVEIGRPALALLRKATTDGADLEVRERAARLLVEISGAARPFVLPVVALVSEIAFSKDGQRMAVACEDKVVRVYDSATRMLRQTLKGHYARVWCVAFSPDGKKLASCAGDYNKPLVPGEIRIWDVTSGALDKTFTGHQGIVVRLAYSPDGKTLYTAGWDESIRSWDVGSATEKAVLTGHQGPVGRVACTPDGKSVVSTSFDGTVRIWNPATHNTERQFRAHEEGIGALAMTPDGKFLFTGSRANSRKDPGVVRMWDFDTGQEKPMLPGPSRKVVSMAVSPDGGFLAMGGGLNNEFGEVKLVDLATNNAIADLRQLEWVECVAFSPDGQWLASGGGSARGERGVVRMWNFPQLIGKSSGQ